MEGLRGLYAATPAFAGVATSKLAEVVASFGKCVEVVADKRSVFTQNEHAHYVVTDDAFRDVRVLCQIGSGYAFERLAVDLFGAKAASVVGSDGAADEYQVFVVFDDEVDLVVAVSPTGFQDFHPATLQKTLDAAHCLLVDGCFHDDDLLQVFGPPPLGEPCGSEAIGVLGPCKGQKQNA